MQAASSFLRNPSWDIAFLVLLVTASFFWGMSGGKKKLVLAILAIYVLNVLMPLIPVGSFLVEKTAREMLFFRGILFLLLLVMLVAFLSRAFRGINSREDLWWKILLLGILGSGFLVASIISTATTGTVRNGTLGLSPIILKFFANPIYSEWWLILPIIGVLFL